jgi:hypothetical protein
MNDSNFVVRYNSETDRVSIIELDARPVSGFAKYILEKNPMLLDLNLYKLDDIYREYKIWYYDLHNTLEGILDKNTFRVKISRLRSKIKNA